MTDEHAVLPDDHVETGVLRRYARRATCLVVAAYKGATMRYLLEHGALHVCGVEPQMWAYEKAVANLTALDPHGKWSLENVALVPWETKSGAYTHLYGEENDGASTVFQPPSLRWKVRRVPAMNVYQWIGGRRFDFAVINCEGCEYMLLYAFERAVDHMLVQFHGPPIPDGQLHPDRHCTPVGSGWYLYA